MTGRAAHSSYSLQASLPYLSLHVEVDQRRAAIEQNAVNYPTHELTAIKEGLP